MWSWSKFHRFNRLSLLSRKRRHAVEFMAEEDQRSDSEPPVSTGSETEETR